MSATPKKTRHLYVVAGSVCLALGVLGIVLPLLPTTPLLLLAAACYARGSERFYNWLIEHRYLGKHIRDYRSGAGIPLKAKVTAIAMVWVTIGATTVFAVDAAWLRAVLIVIAIGVTVYLLRLPTVRK